MLWCVAVVFLTSGCGPELVVLGAVAGTSASTYLYIDGGMQNNYKHSYDMVWAACEKALAGLRALNVQPYKEIGQGHISAVINDEKIRIAVQYKERSVTSVTVRVGLFGNKTASQLLHDKISDNISKD